MISFITAELHVPLSTLFSSVILHDYVELLRKIKPLTAMWHVSFTRLCPVRHLRTWLITHTWFW